MAMIGRLPPDRPPAGSSIRRLLALPLSSALLLAASASAQDSVNGTSDGWTWQASSNGFNVAPPREQLTAGGRVAEDVQLDMHLLYEPVLSYHHHFRFLKDGPRPRTVSVQFDDQKKVEHNITGEDANGIFLPETGLVSASSHPASLTAKRIRYEMRYADGSRKTYSLDAKAYLKAYSAALRATNDLFEDEVEGL